MSCRVALRVGRSSSRCMGKMGNNWSIAQLSGNDWKSEKLQKYLSARSLSIFLSSSGTCFNCFVRVLISLQMLQYMPSISARVFRSTMPWANKSSASSRICSASCQSSKIERGLRLSQISYKSFTNWWSVSVGSNSSDILGNDAVSSTSITNTEWWAANERPLSVIMFGCCILFLFAASTNV